MRWLKLIAILFLWLFFFVVLALVHLWISGLRLPNRWKIVSRWMRGFTRSMRAIINIKVTVEGDAGQLGGGGYVIEHSYMSTLGSYRGEKVVYDRDRANGESAEVDTRVVGGQGNPIKIEYKLHLTDGQWMVYDAVIDDVSLVGNYRSQFARVLQTASLGELIQNLREKASGR
jgi:MlaC protein